jgi:CHAT domain-containing protein
MPARSTLALLIAYGALAAAPKGAQAGIAAAAAEQDLPPTAALTDEARAAIELLRFVLEQEGRDAARELLRETVEGLGEPEPAHVPYLLELDLLAQELGSLEESRLLCESVLVIREEQLPVDDYDLLTAKQNLAVTKHELGDLAGARELFEDVLATWTRLLPCDHPDLLTLKLNLAVTKHELGDLAGARELEEEVLAARSRLLPQDHPDLLAAKLNHAITKKELGDLAGARELEEEVLASWTRILPQDHPDLLAAKQNLAGTRRALGDLAGAHELFEDVLAACTRRLPSDHPDLLGAKMNLAVTRAELGDLAGAEELEEEVLAARTRLLPQDHPDLLAAKQNLAVTRKAFGNLASARNLEEEVLAARTRLLPQDHPDLLTATMNLAGTKRDLGDLAGARVLVSGLLSGVRVQAFAVRAEAARPAREGARVALRRLGEALFLDAATAPQGRLVPELFATLEGLRLASVASSEAAQALGTRPELAELARALGEQRAHLNDRVAAGPEEGESAEDWRKELLAFVEERDRLERELRVKLAEAGVFVRGIEAQELGTRLNLGAAAVSFLRYSREFDKDPKTGEARPNVESFLAFVVTPGGTVERVEIGAASELEALVIDWRAALGRSLTNRGIAVAEAASGAGPLDTLGTRLRERILDPIRAAVPGLSALHVVLDDLLFLVPLDALPLEDGLVGERIQIRNEATLARLLRDRAEVAAEGGLTAAGGIDYDAELGAEALVRLDAATPPVDSGTLRSGARAGFQALPETSGESSSIAALYRTVFERDASLFSGPAATKAALFAAAPRTRFLHLATHGWFASESFKSQLDSLAESSARAAFERAEETLVGFAPETLCGLALAGANRGRDALGRVPGILTAEELASFDLRNCELAVLSACETNVGIRRAGQGIQSLQTALHAAGARTAITSLWKVDDSATRRLFELFYTKLWKEHLGKADALWQAKMALRAEGHPPRDWAGWVLSGNPR